MNKYKTQIFLKKCLQIWNTVESNRLEITTIIRSSNSAVSEDNFQIEEKRDDRKVLEEIFANMNVENEID